ncbi:dual specificity protein phosphatase 22 isoform X2 [Falco peregrinus]|uniref:dual specificity protein phosphatase 22 isoform X2 n=1 Tax=Falco peregrinus TaxID=8954 RepID=UPI00247A20C7|nr:dual specificity protein phosphatase 22 isoform X2 [Falco peregrinus]
MRRKWQWSTQMSKTHHFFLTHSRTHRSPCPPLHLLALCTSACATAEPCHVSEGDHSSFCRAIEGIQLPVYFLRFCLACSLATLKGVKYLCIPAADSPSQNLARHFRESIKFIHECRLTGEGCLVHCLAGVSRSVTLVVAYIMTITDFGWEDALSVVRAARSCANPNMGFQRQLQDFEKHDVDQFRQWLKEEYGENSSQDLQEAKNLLSKYKEQAELQQNTGGRQWNNNFSSVPSLSYSNYTTET